jgi:ubiquinone/menaquinone biosynthesis C-methylase UbiE
MIDLNSIQRASQKQFDRQSANYGKSHILSQTNDIQSALHYLQPKAGQTLLDVATGGGHTGIFFARLGLKSTLADISSAMLENAARLAAEEKLMVETRQHAAEGLPYLDGSFDLVTCRVAAHHFSCPATFIAETARVLKLGGRFLLIDGTVQDGYPLAEEWSHQVEKLRDPSHNRFITPLQWTDLCGHVGLKVVHHELQPFKQPDLEWYFETASTPPENRSKVLKLIHTAPLEAIELFKLNPDEEGKVTWWWQRLVLVAEKH